MNSEDYRLALEEADASPLRFERYEEAYLQQQRDEAAIVEAHIRADDAARHSHHHHHHQETAPGTIASHSATNTSIGRLESYESSSASSSSVQYEAIGGSRGHQEFRRTLSRSATHTSKINKLERHPTALERIETHRTQHYSTVGGDEASATRTRSSRQSKPLPNFGAGKTYPPMLPASEDYVVEFDGADDPLHAQNWSLKKKLRVGSAVAWFSLSATVGSSIFSNATGVVSEIYGVSREVGTLATSLFVLGYAFGPIIWAPFSELYGRRLPVLVAALGFSLFTIAVATAQDLQTIMLCRFFSGFFGSAPLAITAAIFADMFGNEARGLAIAVFSATVFMGPLFAPFMGGFIVQSYLGWRWTMYISSFMGFSSLILCLLLLEETYPPMILVGKASELRRRTKNWGIHAKQEEVELDLRELLEKNVSRPFRILFTEPIVLAVSLYMSFIYGILYLMLTGYAEIFQGVYHMNPGVGGLPYFGMVTGELIAFFVVVAINPAYVRKLKANNNIPVPEWRVPIAIAGGVSFSAGLFWLGWTGYNGKVHWIVPTLSGLLTGFGIFTVFLQLLNYIVDAYLMFAASAIAANTFMRSLFGCVFPLFATYMFNGIGINWTMTLLGCVAALLVPLPVIFYIWGPKLRQKSKFAPSLDLKYKAKKDAEAASAAAGENETQERGREEEARSQAREEEGSQEREEEEEEEEKKDA